MEHAITTVAGIIGLLSAALGLMSALVSRSQGGQKASISSDLDLVRNALAKSNIQDKDHVLNVVDHAGSRLARLHKATSLLLITTVVLSFAMLSGAVYLATRDFDSFLYQELERRDPISFSHRGGQSVEIARIFPDMGTLEGIGDMHELVMGTQDSLDVMLYTAYFFVTHLEKDLEDLLRTRPVRIRFLLMNERALNQAQYDAASIAMGHPDVEKVRSQTRDVRQRLTALMSTIAHDRGSYKGTLEVRWYNNPVLYNMMLRDRNRDSRYLQVGVYTYADLADRPHYRCSVYGRLHIDKMQRQFDELWERDTTSRE